MGSVRPTSATDRDATPDTDVFEKVHRLPRRFGGFGVARAARTRTGQIERFRTAATVRIVTNATGGDYQYRLPGVVTGLTGAFVLRVVQCRRPVGPDEPHAELMVQKNRSPGVRHVPVIKVYVQPANAAGPIVRHHVLDCSDGPPANTGRVYRTVIRGGTVAHRATVVRRTVHRNAVVVRRSLDGRQVEFLS